MSENQGRWVAPFEALAVVRRTLRHGVDAEAHLVRAMRDGRVKARAQQVKEVAVGFEISIDHPGIIIPNPEIEYVPYRRDLDEKFDVDLTPPFWSQGPRMETDIRGWDWAGGNFALTLTSEAPEQSRHYDIIGVEFEADHLEAQFATPKKDERDRERDDRWHMWIAEAVRAGRAGELDEIVNSDDLVIYIEAGLTTRDPNTKVFKGKDAKKAAVAIIAHLAANPPRKSA
jgi:hypothetical protein